MSKVFAFTVVLLVFTSSVSAWAEDSKEQKQIYQIQKGNQLTFLSLTHDQYVKILEDGANIILSPNQDIKLVQPKQIDSSKTGAPKEGQTTASPAQGKSLVPVKKERVKYVMIDLSEKTGEFEAKQVKEIEFKKLFREITGRLPDMSSYKVKLRGQPGIIITSTTKEDEFIAPLVIEDKDFEQFLKTRGLPLIKLVDDLDSDGTTSNKTAEKVETTTATDGVAVINNKELIDESRTQIENLETTGLITVVSPKEIEAIEIPEDPELIKSLRSATQALLMKESGSVVFVGQPGVGKTYRMGLMLAYLNKIAPPKLRQRVYARASSAAFAARKDGRAGTIEENVQKLIELSKMVPITLLMDEVHTLQGAGTHSHSSVDVLELMKDALASGQIQIIGTTTDYEFETSFGARPALAQRFVKFSIGEPNKAELTKIIKDRYRADSGRELSQSVVDVILKVSEVFGGTFAEPRRSLKLVDFLSSREALDQKLIQDPTAFIELASEYYNMNIDLFLNAEKNEKLITEAEVASNDKLIGLDHSINQTFKSVRYWMSQEDRTKPLSLLMYGGKGTGKTVFSSSIAKALEYKFLKISLPSETPQQLMSKIVTQLEMYPFTIFLMDEVDKTNPTVQEALLSVLDSPTVTRQKLTATGDPGPVVSVPTKNAMFLFTTNAGEDFSAQQPPSDEAKERISRTGLINPYLLDRMKKLIAFTSPDLEGLRRIIRTKWEVAASRFLAEAEKNGITADVVFKKVMKRLSDNKESRPSIGFSVGTPAASSTPDAETLAGISVRRVEGIVESIAEDVLYDLRTQKKSASKQSVESAGGTALRCLPLFTKK